ncbi:hypothetical protein ACQKMD_15475 [Viridibacillus sp. NPDC096237]
MTASVWCDIWLELKKSDWKPTTLIRNKGAAKNILNLCLVIRN